MVSSRTLELVNETGVFLGGPLEWGSHLTLVGALGFLLPLESFCGSPSLEAATLTSEGHCLTDPSALKGQTG